MALVVFLKGVNVGGYKTFRPSVLAGELKAFDVVNIGAAGTFVVRKPVSQTALRAELTRRLPFATDAMICEGREILRLSARDPFAGQRARSDITQFVSVLAKRRPPLSPLPFNLPPSGPWGVSILGQQDRFVFGVYRREMKAISYLGKLEKLFGVSVTTRSWTTISAIVRILGLSREQR